MPTRNSGGPIHASIVPNWTPSIMRGIDPSWLAGKIWPLIWPLLRFSSRAMYRLHHSCWTSFSVAVAHLKAIVAASAGQQLADIKIRTVARTRMSLLLRPSLDEAGEQQREGRDVGDRDEGQGMDDDERDESRHDFRRRHAEHGLGDEHVDRERRREHPHGEVGRDDGAEVDKMEGGGVTDGHQ